MFLFLCYHFMLQYNSYHFWYKNIMQGTTQITNINLLDGRWIESISMLPRWIFFLHVTFATQKLFFPGFVNENHYYLTPCLPIYTLIKWSKLFCIKTQHQKYLSKRKSTKSLNSLCKTAHSWSNVLMLRSTYCEQNIWTYYISVGGMRYQRNQNIGVLNRWDQFSKKYILK